MTPNEYQELAARTAGQFKSDNEAFCNWALGLAGEAGEVADYLKKVIFHGHELDREVLKKELGDVSWYLALTAKQAGLTLEEVMEHNIAKLKARYPEGFSSERSVNRTT